MESASLGLGMGNVVCVNVHRFLSESALMSMSVTSGMCVFSVCAVHFGQGRFNGLKQSLKMWREIIYLKSSKAQ